MNHLYFRLAISEAGLAKGYLFTQGLPPPQPDFKDHSVKVDQSDGGQARHGYQNVTLLWEVLTQAQGARLRQLVESANGTIYATFPRGDGKSGGWNYIDVSGTPLIPDMAPAARPEAGGWVYQNVQLVIRNLTIINEPANF